MSDPAAGAVRIQAGELAAEFLPGRGMLGASLTHRGEQLLRRIGDLDAAAAKGSTAGIPLLHPWANRLAGLTYRAAGRAITLDPASPMLHFDGSGLPIHGVPWSKLSWSVTAQRADAVAAQLSWDRPELLAVFPFPHRLTLKAEVGEDALTIGLTLDAGIEGPVPVAFGFHPYLGLPGAPRDAWRLELPEMRRLALDARGIPTGAASPFGPFAGPLGGSAWDDGFAVESRAAFAISGGGRRIEVAFLEDFPFAQIYSPQGSDFVAIEPMAAPANALASGRNLTLVEPGARIRALFRIRVEDLPGR